MVKVENKGFTLVEILAVIVIISMIVVIAIPTSQGIAKKTNEKMYSTKLDIAVQSAKLWSFDKIICFKNGEFDKIDISSRSDDCKTNIEYITKDGDIKSYSMVLSQLAEEGYYDYDEADKIIDPRNKSQNLNGTLLFINYNIITKKIVSITIEKDPIN